MADERMPYQIIRDMAAARRPLSDEQVLAELAAIPPLADEDDPCWDNDEYWHEVAYPYLALWEIAAERKLRAAIPLMLDRACFGDPGEIMRNLCHALEGIVAPDWTELTGPCITALKSRRPGTRLWAAHELRRLRDPAALAALEVAARDEIERVRDWAREAVKSTREKVESREALLRQLEESVREEGRPELPRELAVLGIDAEGVTFSQGMVDKVTLQDPAVFFDRAEALFRAAPALSEIVFQQAADPATDVRLDASRLAASPYLARLAGLGFHRCGLGAEGAVALVRSPHLAGLRRLGILHDSLGDAGAEALAASPHLAGLEVLDLTDNGIGRKGAFALAGSSHLEGLRQLFLAENPLGVPGAILLSLSLFFEHLDLLVVSRDQVGEQGRDMLEGRFHEHVQFVSTAEAEPLEVPGDTADAGETPDAAQARRMVRVVDGAFRGMEGEIRAVDGEGRRATVILDIFGIQTPVDLSFDQVEGLEPEHAAPATTTPAPEGPLPGGCDMNDLVKKMQSQWDRNPGATEEQIRRTERELCVSFPSDYREFLAWSNGGVGILGQHYVSLWPVENIPQLNEDYQIGKYLPNVVGIGSNGGPECYALDYRDNNETPPLVRVPFGDLAPESVVILGESLTRWLAEIM